MVRHNELILIEEHVRDGNSLVQQASGIAAQVENQSIQIRVVELLQCCRKFRIGLFVECGKPYVPDSRPDLKRHVHRMLGNLIARNREAERLRITFTHHVHMNDSALGTLQQVGDLGSGKPIGRFALHAVNDVARANAGFCRG